MIKYLLTLALAVTVFAGCTQTAEPEVAPTDTVIESEMGSTEIDAMVNEELENSEDDVMMEEEVAVEEDAMMEVEQ